MTAAEFLLVESQGAWSGPMAERFLDDGAALARAGQRVSVFLVQDGVTAALPGAGSGVDRLAAAGATVWVDDFSLAQRALPADRVVPARPWSTWTRWPASCSAPACGWCGTDGRAHVATGAPARRPGCGSGTCCSSSPARRTGRTC